MSFLDFDAREYLESGSPTPAKVANPAKVGAATEQRGQSLATLAALAGLPPEISEGLARLRTMRAPRWTKAERWRVFVGDAGWLADAGIAADALNRGWSPLDLWGVSGDDSWQSLAAWIDGRRDEHGRACVLLTEIRGDRQLPYAVHASQGRHSWHYPAPAPASAVLPWTI